MTRVAWLVAAVAACKMNQPPAPPPAATSSDAAVRIAELTSPSLDALNTGDFSGFPGPEVTRVVRH